MNKIVDERHCPNCGHGVMNWSMVCPGCNQVPLDTPAGRKIIQGRRRQAMFQSTGFWVGLFVAAVLALMLYGASSTFHVFFKSPRAAKQLQAYHEQLFSEPALSSETRAKMLNRVVKYLNREDYMIGFSAATLLLQANDQRAIPWLISLIDDSNSTIAVYAQAILLKASGESFGTDRARWESWWKAHQGEALRPMEWWPVNMVSTFCPLQPLAPSLTLPEESTAQEATKPIQQQDVMELGKEFLKTRMTRLVGGGGVYDPSSMIMDPMG
ncbi:MAG: hypothetical protein HY595_00240, partial [Candidatus Omnitrophica bacterium]|nr:hypothetical protein [Candidatus Omnitrophota bacterium]